MTRTKKEPRTRPVMLSRAGKSFVTYLKFHRMKLGMTQARVAKEAGISQGHYCEIEKGYKKPLPETHKRIAEALGRPLDEFTAKLYGVNPADMVTQPAAAGK